MKRLHASNAQNPQLVRRVIQSRDNSQINAVNKINSLSGVSMQPTKIVRCQIPQNHQREASQRFCFVCDEVIVGPVSMITETETIYSKEKITKKIARMVGDSFCVIVSEDDVICRRCSTLFNTMDKHEQDLENVRNRLRTLVNKKYGIDDEEPPAKVQRVMNVESSVRSPSEVIRRRNETIAVVSPSSPAKRGPVKLYKCIACDFKTTDLTQFQPHSNECKGQGQKGNQQSITSVQKSTPSPANKVQTVNRFQKVGETTITRNISPANMQRITPNQQRNIPQKVKPYKCKMCLERFETRESAQLHARIHTNQLKVNQDKRVLLSNANSATKHQQKPLTEIIKEALSEDDQEGEILEFHSCNSCSLTFVNKKLYIQHMKTHENSNEKSSVGKSQSYGKSQDTLGDLESIFEKMHSENSHTTSTNGDKNVMVTTQEGGITYNITIPQDEDADVNEVKEEKERIDMPSLSSVKVSMPSLHDEERSQDEKELQGEEVPMDLEEMSGSEGQQLKFIVDENGQFLQLDNHILTTDAEGNQILVGVDGNQVLVQLQGGEESLDSEGASIQMALGDGAQGQGMILIQGPDGESQLIDASMLQQTEDGNLVLQQEDGQTHLISTNGVTFSDGQVQLAVSAEGEEGQQVYIEGMEGDGSQKDAQESADGSAFDDTKEENTESDEKSQTEENNEEEEEKPSTSEMEQNDEVSEQVSADSAIGECEEKSSADEIKGEEEN